MKKAICIGGVLLAAFGIATAYATDMGAYGGVGTESLFLIDSNGKTLQLKPGTMSSSFSLTLPTADGTSNQVLQTNGSGVLSWTTPASNGVPSGTIIAFGGSSCPTGYLPADGQPYSTTTYASLYNAIGYTWGGSAGTFNVPDLRNRYVRGSGTNNDGNGGTSVSVGAYQADDLKSHSHNVGQQLNNAVGGAGGTFIVASNSATQWTPTASGGGTETRPKSYGVLYCIAQ